MNAEIRKFRGITQRFLQRTHELFPQQASELGLHQFDHLLGANDAGTHREFEKLLGVTLTETEALPENAFSGDDWIDRRGFLAMLRTGRLFDGALRRWRTNPQVHCDSAINSIFHLLGRIEVEKLHRRLVLEEGWSIRRFNDWILSFGAIPWSWIWQSQLQSPP